MSDHKKKAELLAELQAAHRENETLRENLKEALDLNDAYLADQKMIDGAHQDTIEKMVPLVDAGTTLKNKTVKHRRDAAKGGNAYEPLAEHKAALLAHYEAEQRAGNKYPNKTTLTTAYIKKHPDLGISFDALRKSLPKRKKNS